jgi:hypothetical protein
MTFVSLQAPILARAESLYLFKLGYSYLPNSSSALNDNLNTICLGCGVGFHRTAGLGIEMGYQFGKRPFVLGLRYTNLKATATINAASGPVVVQNLINTAEVLVGYRRKWRRFFFTPKIGYGIFNDSTFSFTNSAGTSFSGKAGSVQSLFYGLGAEWKLWRMLWGLEIGNTTLIAENFSSGGSSPASANSQLTFSRVDFSGLYYLFTLGFQY